jgi:flagellar motor component MotA
MLALLGITLVFAAVLGGFMLERGNPYVLMQPAELLIICGAAVGIVLLSNPPALIGKMVRGVASAFRGPRHNLESFLRDLGMLYELFVYAQRAGGIMQLEADVDDPTHSRIFTNHPEFLRDNCARDFVCDSLRMLVIGVTAAHELDQLMELDIEVQRRGRFEPVNALSAMAEALPGLGIVAAVLGVVITMEALGGGAGDHWAEGSGGAGGHVSGHPALLRGGGAAGGAPRKPERDAGAVSAGAADRHHCVCPGRIPHSGAGICAAVDSAGDPPHVSGDGNRDQARRRDSAGAASRKGRRGDDPCGFVGADCPAEVA